MASRKKTSKSESDAATRDNATMKNAIKTVGTSKTSQTAADQNPRDTDNQTRNTRG